MGVVVVGDLAHHRIDRPFPRTEHGVRRLAELAQHVLELISRRVDAMLAPHHHGYAADLAIRHPAHIVLVIPGGETRCRTQLAGGLDGTAHRYCMVRSTVVPGGTIVSGDGEEATTLPEPGPEIAPTWRPAFSMAVYA